MVAGERALEAMVNREFWRNRRVFITGHTGFKGAWLSLLLRSLGAQVYGYALAPENDDWLFKVADIESDLHHVVGDVRDAVSLHRCLRESEADIVIHLAAQSLVLRSYQDPILTYETNVNGTINLLDAARQTPSVRAILIVTSDKCYENNGTNVAFCEGDPLGGKDPYSSSKACAELVTASFRSSFPQQLGHTSSVRAGNVIGGGDWAENRLIPDLIRAFIRGEPARIRHPDATRPWQHVLDPLKAYLLLAERLTDSVVWAGEWNVGPEASDTQTVSNVVEAIIQRWGEGARWEQDGVPHSYEAPFLSLNCSKAKTTLGWHPTLSIAEGIDLTAEWYRAFRDGKDMRAVTLKQIERCI